MGTNNKRNGLDNQETELDRMVTIDLRSRIEKAISEVSSIRGLLYDISENDQMLGDMFDVKLMPQVDQLTQIGLTLGEIYGYTVADDLLSQREVR